MTARQFVRVACACAVAVGLAVPATAAIAKAPYPPVVPDVCTTDINGGGTVTIIIGNFCSENNGSGGNINVNLPGTTNNSSTTNNSGPTDASSTTYPVQASYGDATVESLLQQLVRSQSSTEPSYVAEIDVARILPTKAGRYPVKFTVNGQVFTRTYTVGKAVSITAVKATKTSKGVRVTGKTTKKSKVKVRIKRGSKIISTKTVPTSSSTGRFSYHKTLPKGKYTITITYIANTKYFGKKAITKTFTKTY